ncbi:DUF4124 domain-containing protein [Niveibacterium terrae]|uniref:DUF4124 domain-containing protein n=1 Tax=Niveibacterium terrae TaxID=3373598 RepID=UPI003A934257
MKTQTRIAIRQLCALALLVVLGPVQAGVWKCTDARGRSSYSDTPCAASQSARSVNASPASAGILPTPASEAGDSASGTRPRRAETAQSPSPASARNPAKVCPSERDIANLETRATSITLDPKSKAFLLAEVRRARACSREDTNYTREDWERIQNGIRDQDRTLASDREAARATVRDTHSIAASAQERERIEGEKRRETSRHETARCDESACWDTRGHRYERHGSGYTSASGQSCRLEGGSLSCR